MPKVDVVATKNYGRRKIGDEHRIASADARALVALGYVRHAKVEQKPPQRRATYNRRDMVATPVVGFQPVAPLPAAATSVPAAVTPKPKPTV